MRLRWIVLSLLISTVFSIGCASLKLPDTAGDLKLASSFGYHPIDPLPVYLACEDNTVEGGWKKITQKISDALLLEYLPDETMRMAIGQVDANGSITYGIAKMGIANKTYVVILDYIKFTTTWVGIDISNLEDNTKVTINRDNPQLKVPVYIGVGLRLTANVYVNEGSVDLGNLVALGAAANAKQVYGTMVVQTLGITGENVSGIIPMPSEINASTIQNAILSLGAIKAKIYDGKTKIKPRAVGLYNNIAGRPETIHSFITALVAEGAWLWINKEDF